MTETKDLRNTQQERREQSQTIAAISTLTTLLTLCIFNYGSQHSNNPQLTSPLGCRSCAPCFWQRSKDPASLLQPGEQIYAPESEKCGSTTSGMSKALNKSPPFLWTLMQITKLIKKKKIDSCLLYFRRKAQILLGNKSVLVSLQQSISQTVTKDTSVA